MRKAAVLLLVFLLAALPALGETALSVNGREFTTGQVDAWMWIVRQSYSDTLEYYDRTFGIDYWTLTYPNGRSVWDSVKAEAFRQLVMIGVFCDIADEQGLHLSDGESALCAEASSEVTADGTFTSEDLCAIYRMRLLAGKAYSLMLSYRQIDEEAIAGRVDRSAYISYEAEYLYIPFYVYASDTAAESEAKALLNQLKGFEGPYEDAARLNRSVSSGEIKLCPADCAGDEKLLEAIRTLKVGETSEIIKTDYGLFVLRLTNDTDDSLYREEIENRLLEERKRDYRDEYNRLYATTEYSLNTAYWDTVTP